MRLDVVSFRKWREAGVSEAIGFIIIFGIIIAGIGLVTLYGYPMLLQQQSSSDEQIMEKNLIVLQNDVKSLAYKTVPYKETSLKIGGGSLVIYNMSYETITGESSANFSIYDDNGYIATPANPIKFYPGDLRYESTGAQTGMSLENGAVVKRMLAQEGSTMLAEPRWFYDSQTKTGVIYLIGFNTTEAMARTGVGTVKMALDQTNSSEYSLTYGDRVYVYYGPNTNANYETAWDNYFKNTLKLDGPDAYGAYIFPGDMEKLVINRYEIMIKSV